MEISLSQINSMEIPERFGAYKTIRVLGQGAFGAVVKALDQRNDTYVAAKIVDREQLIDTTSFKHFEHETRILSSINHPNIVHIKEILYFDDKIVIVMDICKCGDLFDHLTRNGRVSVKDSYKILSQLVSALAYLHQKGISHRDLKPENIVLDFNLTPKIIDFGVCCQTNSLTSSFVGTDFFIPPEILHQKKYDPKKADIYSLGVTAFLMTTGFLPFRTHKEYALFAKNGRLIGSDCIPSESLKNIILKMMSFDPDNRPTATELYALIQKEMEAEEKTQNITLPAINQHLSLSNHHSLLTVSKRTPLALGRDRSKQSALNGSMSWIRKRSAQSIPIMPHRISPSIIATPSKQLF